MRVKLTRKETVLEITDDEWTALTSAFRCLHYVRLPALIDRELARVLYDWVQSVGFFNREDAGIACELSAHDGRAISLLSLMLNDPALRAFVGSMVGQTEDSVRSCASGAIGAADVPERAKLLGYPWALLQETPEAAVLGIVGASGMFLRRSLRARWRMPAMVAVAIGAFLVFGDLRDTAPTHHPVRALAAVWWILIGMGVDAIGQELGVLTKGKVRFAASGAAALLTIIWCASLPARWSAAPGRGESERRDAQIAHGTDLRSRAVAHAIVTPCAFEHFALIAAWGEPQRAEVARSVGGPARSDCPRVVER